MIELVKQMEKSICKSINNGEVLFILVKYVSLECLVLVKIFTITHKIEMKGRLINMKLTMLKGKIHRAKVVQAELDDKIIIMAYVQLTPEE